MKSIITVIIAGILIFGTSSCRQKLIQGEGSIVSETRNVASFSSVYLEGNAQVEVYQSNENRVEVSGYSNLVPVYETYVSGNRLTLRFQEKYVNIRGNNIRIKVYATNVTKVRTDGSGDFYVGENLETGNMHAEINGSGNINFGNNLFNDLKLYISGSGDIDAKQAEGNYVYAEISGSGNITTTAIEKLDAKIDGSGNIYYCGTPKSLNVSVSGSGKVKKSY